MPEKPRWTTGITCLPVPDPTCLLLEATIVIFPGGWDTCRTEYLPESLQRSEAPLHYGQVQEIACRVQCGEMLSRLSSTEDHCFRKGDNGSLAFPRQWSVCNTIALYDNQALHEMMQLASTTKVQGKRVQCHFKVIYAWWVEMLVDAAEC